MVSIHNVANMINGNDAIAITIKCQTKVAVMQANGLADGFGVRGATIGIDILTIRFIVDYGDRGTPQPLLQHGERP